MNSNLEEKKVVKFKYIFADDYNPVYANGVFGGVTPAGEIVINFYLERHALPISQSHHIKQDGTLDNNVFMNEPDDLVSSMVRFIKSGVVLNLEGAKTVHSWLEKQIKSSEKNLQARKQLKGS